MTRFETPEIKVVKFNTPDILTLSANTSYEGTNTDIVTPGSGWDFDDIDLDAYYI